MIFMFRKEDVFIIVSFVALTIAFLLSYNLYLNYQEKYEISLKQVNILVSRVSELEQREEKIISINDDLLDRYDNLRYTKENEIINYSKDLFVFKRKYYDYFTKYNNLRDEYDRMKMVLAQDKNFVIEDGAYLQGIAFIDEGYYCIYDKKVSLDEQLYTVIHEWAHFRGYHHNDNESTVKMDNFVLKTAEEYLKQYSY